MTLFCTTWIDVINSATHYHQQMLFHLIYMIIWFIYQLFHRNMSLNLQQKPVCWAHTLLPHLDDLLNHKQNQKPEWRFLLCKAERIKANPQWSSSILTCWLLLFNVASELHGVSARTRILSMLFINVCRSFQSCRVFRPNVKTIIVVRYTKEWLWD